MFVLIYFPIYATLYYNAICFMKIENGEHDRGCEDWN